MLWQGSFQPLADHMAQLAVVGPVGDYSSQSRSQLYTLALVMLTVVIGCIHYYRKFHGDKIRVRLTYGFFAWLMLACSLFLALQPQHYDILLRMLIVFAAPAFGHFIALTRTAATNVVFLLLVGVTLLLTGYNVWTFWL